MTLVQHSQITIMILIPIQEDCNKLVQLLQLQEKHQHILQLQVQHHQTKTIPIYDTINITEADYRKEPLYGTVCYQSTKNRKLLDAGKTVTKWSKYNDKDLLDNGWYYTGAKKLDK